MANYVCEIALSEEPLRLPAKAEVEGAGAIVDFWGNVRAQEGSETISGIEYEAHRNMAEHQLRAVAEEAGREFPLQAVVLHHRIGFVRTGESSVFLRVAAAHRGEAFRAAQWIVDELKKRVPIWKKPRP